MDRHRSRLPTSRCLHDRAHARSRYRGVGGATTGRRLRFADWRTATAPERREGARAVWGVGVGCAGVLGKLVLGRRQPKHNQGERGVGAGPVGVGACVDGAWSVGACVCACMRLVFVLRVTVYCLCALWSCALIIIGVLCAVCTCGLWFIYLSDDRDSLLSLCLSAL